jgi:ATP-dependent DNA helicase RecG
MNIEELMKLIASGENEKVEFKRTVSSDIGEEMVALSNAGGGVIIIGIDDYGKVVGCEVRDAKEKVSNFLSSITPPIKVKFHQFNIDGKDILAVEVEESKSIATIGGIAYIRTGTSKRPLSLPEIISLGAEYVLIPLDSTHTSVRPSEIDEGYWRWFIRKRSERGLKKIPKLKEKLGVVKKVDNDIFLTLAGLLFFHRDPQQILHHTYVRVVWGEISERIEGPIWKQVDKVIERLRELLPRKSIIKGVERLDLPIIPLEVLREAIVNALVHRNYGIHSEVFVELKANKLEIRNPGSFPPGTTPEHPIPIPRNPLLYELMYQAGYVERQGGGIDMMKKLCAENGIKMNYDITPYYTTLRFEAPLYEALDEMERKIISMLVEPLSSSEIARALAKSKPTVLKKLKSLEKRGLVKSVGSGPRTRWVIS